MKIRREHNSIGLFDFYGELATKHHVVLMPESPAAPESKYWKGEFNLYVKVYSSQRNGCF